MLYDPARREERLFCATWKERLTAHLPRSRVRRNQPYRGWSDGLTAYLRTLFPPDRYLGVELEVNQRLLKRTQRRKHRVYEGILRSLRETL